MDPIHVFFLSSVNIVDNFDYPVIMSITNGTVSVARNFVVELRDGGRDVVRVQVAGCRSVLKTNNIAMLKVFYGSVGIVGRLTPLRQDNPVVVVIFIVIACNLLLSRTYGVNLYVRVE